MLYRRIILSLLGLALLQGCVSISGGNSGQSYKLYPGPALPPAELAELDITHLTVTVDGLRVDWLDYATVHLLSGKHSLRIDRCCGGVVLRAGMYGASQRSFNVDLEAGGSYKLIGHRKRGGASRYYFWVEDATTGAVIAGEEKP